MTTPPPPIRFLVAFAVGLAGALTASCGQNPGQDASDWSAHISATTKFAQARLFAREVDATADTEGGLWTVFLSSRVEKQEEVEQVDLVLRYMSAAGDFQELELARGATLASPTLAGFDGGVYVVWEDLSNAGSSLRGLAVRLDAASKLQASETPDILEASASARMPDITTLASGGLALAWQALGEPEGLNYNVYLSIKNESGAPWTTPSAVTQSEGDDWCPQVVATSSGAKRVIHIAFDRFVPGSENGFDVLHIGVSAADGSIEETVVASGPNYQGHPSIAADVFAPSDDVWIAYEEAPQFGEFGPLRTRRMTRLAKITRRNEGTTVAHAVLPKTVTAMQRGDFPKVQIGAAGLVLSRRVPNRDYQARNKARNSFYATWRTRILTFPPHADALDFELAGSDGDNLNDSALVVMPGQGGAIRLVFATDARSNEFTSKWAFGSSIEGLWRLASASIELPKGQPRSFPDVENGAPKPELATQAAGASGLAQSKRSADVFYGDLHRHTHMSRCAGGQDGTFLDAIRYARGPGALDFLAITDHFQHLTSASWWRSRRDAERWNAPGSLAVFPGIERTVTDVGHQNLIWPGATIAGIASRDATPPRFAQGEVIAIPHMSSLSDNAFNWSALDTKRHRLIEIHQGRRGSYEGQGLPHAAADSAAAAGEVSRLPEILSASLATKLPGFISSSDHGSSSHGYAGVYLPNPDRALRLPSRTTLFQALYNANTFATTGPAPSPTGAPKLLHLGTDESGLEIQATSPGLAYIEIIRDGVQIHRLLATGDSDTKTTGKSFSLLLNLRLLNSRGADLTVRAKGRSQSDEGAPVLLQSASLRRKIGDGISLTELKSNQIRISFPPNGRADADLTFDLHAPEGATLEFEYQGKKTEWDSHTAATGRATRLHLGDKKGQPLLDITRIGIDLDKVQTEATVSALFRATFVPPAGFQSSVYYARAVWSDGNMAWSSLVRLAD